MSRSEKIAFLCLLCLYCLWGSTFLGIRFAVQTVPPFIVGVIRHGFGGLALVTFLVAGRNRKAFGSRTQIFNALKMGLITAGISNAALAWAGTHVPSGISAVAFATMPLFLVLLNWALFAKVSPSLTDWIAISLGLSGSIIVPFVSTSLSGHPLSWFDLAMLALAPSAWAVGSLYGKRVAMPPNILASAALQMLSGAFIQSLAAAVHGDWTTFSIHQVSTPSLLGVLYLAVGGSLAGYTCFATAIRSLDPRIVSTYAFMNPVIALTLGVIWGERLLTPSIMLGSILSVGGVAVMLLGSLRNARLAKSRAAVA